MPADSGMDDRAVRQHPVRARRVVIGDDDIEAAGASDRDLIDRGYPTVNRDQQAGSISDQALHGGGRKSVPVLGTTRKVRADVSTERPQRSHHHRRRTDSVDVVITVNDDPVPVADVPEDQLDHSVDPGKQARVVALAGIEQLAHRGCICVPATDEYLREHVANPELSFKFERRRDVIRRKLDPRRGFSNAALLIPQG